MAIKAISDIINSARTLIGDNTTDDALAFMEDLSDTMNDYDTKTHDQTDYEQKYKDLDAQWRKRYADRFNGKRTEEDDEEDDSYDLPDPPKKTYLDLFEEVKPNA